MSGSSSSSTTTYPSPYDYDKAERTRLMRNFLMQNFQAGITGQPGGPQQDYLRSMLEQNRYYSGRYGVSHNEPLIKDQERSLTESITKPQPDLLKSALDMYKASDTKFPGGSITKGETTPGMADYLKLIVSLASLAAG